ncbi:MAG: pyridoxamine 5'-phosphate oxidase family protein [Anaerolineae bacterium]
MAKTYDHITDSIAAFIAEQPMFFVGTAPLSADGHVNLSPKGLDTFRILSSNRVAYLDMTGSGNETAAHLRENGRITFMFCAFKGEPNIVRLYGSGQVILPDTPAWDELFPHFSAITGMRQIITADIHRATTSCGYAVPLMKFERPRDTLIKYWEKKADGVSEYQQRNNMHSIDGLPTPFCKDE